MACVRGHRSLAVDPQLPFAMLFQRNVVVIGGDQRFPAGVGSYSVGQHLTHHLCHRLAGSRGVAAGPGGVVKILGARAGAGVQCSKPVSGLGSRQVMIANRRSDCAGPAVYHQPQKAVLIGLQFDEVIPAAQCRELQRAFAAAERFETRVAQRVTRQFPRQGNRRGPVPPAGRHCPADIPQHPAGNRR